MTPPNTDRNETSHYFSLQFSAIQKTILRQDRLWSMAGISMTLSRLNEIGLSRIVEAHNGLPLVAGGGKFTARFQNRADADAARTACEKALAVGFPMLERQISDVVQGADMTTALKGVNGAGGGALDQLNRQKRGFRGYGVSFNPHLMLCDECGEYPAEHQRRFGEVRIDDGRENQVSNLCRICNDAFDAAKIDLAAIETEKNPTTIEAVYAEYLNRLQTGNNLPEGAAAPRNFENLFPPSKPADDNDSERRRMAVFFADVNNMKDKVNIWINQPEEDVLTTFSQVNQVFIDILVDALFKTFPKLNGEWLPFRLIIAGGDDFCMVTAEEYILRFTANLSESLYARFKALPRSHPLNRDWLEAEAAKAAAAGRAKAKDFKPYCLGASFVIASVHTPFRKIHEVGEELMKNAKRETDRLDNGVGWRIMAEDSAQSDRLLDFEKPVFIEKDIEKENWDRLCFRDYLDLCQTHRHVSPSQKFQIVEKMIQLRNDPAQLERWMKAHASTEGEKSITGLLEDPRLKRGKNLSPERLAAMFELMSIKGATTHARN